MWSVKTGSCSKGLEELVWCRMDSGGRLNGGLLSLNHCLCRFNIRWLTGNSSLRLLHFFHPLLEILLGVSFGVFLERFV
jgi:hypothetical protein